MEQCQSLLLPLQDISVHGVGSTLHLQTRPCVIGATPRLVTTPSRNTKSVGGGRRVGEAVVICPSSDLRGTRSL